MTVTRSTATIRITNLRLQAIVGINEWERTQRQNIIVNVTTEFDPAKAIASDFIDDTLDYKAIKTKILAHVENSSYFLLEKLTDALLGTVMEDSRVMSASVRIDKVGALRYADSVSIELSAKRNS